MRHEDGIGELEDEDATSIRIWDSITRFGRKINPPASDSAYVSASFDDSEEEDCFALSRIKHPTITELKNTSLTKKSFPFLSKIPSPDSCFNRTHNTSAKLFLHDDNSKPHICKTTTAFTNNSVFTRLPRPPYGPDLSRCDFFLFHTLK